MILEQKWGIFGTFHRHCSASVPASAKPSAGTPVPSAGQTAGLGQQWPVQRCTVCKVGCLPLSSHSLPCRVATTLLAWASGADYETSLRRGTTPKPYTCKNAAPTKPLLLRQDFAQFCAKFVQNPKSCTILCTNNNNMYGIQQKPA